MWRVPCKTHYKTKMVCGFKAWSVLTFSYQENIMRHTYDENH